MSAQDTEMHVDAGRPEGPGQRLKRAREAAAISIGEVSARLHLDVKTVRAIEADDYSTLPAPAFVRGYLRGYARMMNVPVEPLVASFDIHGLAPPPLVADISERPQAKSSDFPVQAFTWLIVIALAVLVFLWWRGQVFTSNPIAADSPGASLGKGVVVRAPENRAAQSSNGGDLTGGNPVALPSKITLNPGSETITLASESTMEPQASAMPVDTRPTQTVDAAAAASGDETTAQLTGSAAAFQPQASEPAADGPNRQGDEQSTQAATSSQAQAGVNSRSGTQLASVVASASETPTPESTSAILTASPAPVDEEGEVTLNFGHDTWVEIYDRNESRLYWNLARKGREVSVSGLLPIRILLGKIADVKVRFNGEAVDYSPFMARGVARFVLRSTGITALPEKRPASPASQ